MGSSFFSKIGDLFKQLYKSQHTFYLSSILTLFILTLGIIYIVKEDNKSVNKVLLSRESTINSEISRLENINDILEAEILLLKNELKSLSKQKDKEKLSKISKYLADSDMEGIGLEIIISDSHSPLAPVQDESTIVHNTDLLKIVNFLWSQDATAISINGERIVPNSYISCVGPTILINKKRINSPFTILAIGKKLNETETKNDVFMLSLKLRGIEYKITQKENIQILAGKYTTFKE